jgi:hypothetical protein
VDPRAGLDYVEKRKLLTLPGLEHRPLGTPVLSQSLYRLRYPGSVLTFRYQVKILEHIYTTLLQATCLIHLTILDFSILVLFVEKYNQETSHC